MLPEITKEYYTESELIQALIKKNTSAFGYLYDNYSAALFTAITATIEDVQKASDILQEVFIMIWKKIDTYYAVEGSLFTWVLSITKIVTVDALRLQKRQQLKLTVALDRVVVHKEINPYLEFENANFKTAVLKLKPHYRVLIELSHYYGYSQSEISFLLKIPLYLLASQIKKANEDVRGLLSSDCFPPNS